MKKIRKAIIPAAGLGTRMLPISYAVPKEMLPIVDLPAVYHLVKEAAGSGIEDILIITNRGKEAMESFFDRSTEYETALSAKGKTEEIKMLREISDMANVYFLRQKETRGLGHAVGRARKFVGDEPFVVLYGDDVILSDVPVCAQLAAAYEKYGKPCCGVKPVPWELVYKYCSLKAESHGDNTYDVTDMIEKPKPEQVWTNLSILGRVLMTPEIFDILENTAPGAGGEIQLTDAMERLLAEEEMYAVVVDPDEGCDTGTPAAWAATNARLALADDAQRAAFLEALGAKALEQLG
jgi:UTP--glucose-1-phosphate uridylyltransferase